MSMKHIKILVIIFTILLTAFVLFCEAKNSDSSPDPGMQSGNESEAEAEAEAPDTTEALTDALMDQSDLAIESSNDTDAQTAQDVLTLSTLSIDAKDLPDFDLSGAWTNEAGSEAIVNALEEGGALYISSEIHGTLEEERAGRCQTYKDKGISYTVSDTVVSSSASALAINAAAGNSYRMTTILVSITGDTPCFMEFSIDRLADDDGSLYTAVSDYIRTAFQLDIPVAEDIDIPTDSGTLQPSTVGERDEPIIVR